MKKSLIVLLAVVMLVSLLALPVGAWNVQGVDALVVLGDSISTGYGLAGAVADRPGYANLVADALGLKRGQGYANYAVDGYTSQNILAKARANAATLEQADLILLTCGGNDVLGKMLEIVCRAAGGSSSDLKTNINTLKNMSEDTVKSKLYADANQTVIDNALKAYRANMAELVAYLHTTAYKARIVFLTQYNPLSGVDGAKVLDAYAEDVIGRLNAIMVETTRDGGCEVVDTHAVMVGNGATLSNIMNSDIHPNTKGHKAMAEAVMTYLGIDASATGETTASASMTTTIPTVQSTDITTAVPEISETEGETETTTLPSETSSQASDEKDEGNIPATDDGKTSPVPIILAVALLAVGAVVTVVAILLRKKR